MKEIAHLLHGKTLLHHLHEDDGITNLLEVMEEVHLEIGVLGDVLEMGRVVGNHA